MTQSLRRAFRALSSRPLTAWGMAVFASLLAALRGPSFAPDSESYLRHSPARPAGYEIFLDVTRALGGGGLRLTVFLQSLLMLSAAGFLIHRIRVRLHVPFAASLLMWILVAPAWLAFATVILSESLALALLLFGFAEGVEALVDGRDRHILFAIAATAGATFVRTQFLFAWPVLCAGVAVHVVRHRGAGAARLLALSLLLFAIGPVAGRVYALARTGNASRTSLTGLQVATVGAFLAEPADAETFEDAQDVRAARIILKDLYAKHELASTNPTGEPSAMYLGLVYNDIWRGTIMPALSEGGHEPATAGEWDHLNTTSLRLGLGLLRRHPMRYATHVASLLWSYYRYLLLAISVAFAAAAARIRESGNPVWKVGVVVGGLWYANILTVCMIEIPMARYSCYTDILVGIWLVAALAKSEASGAGMAAAREVAGPKP